MRNDHDELRLQYRILRFFKFDHLPAHLQEASEPFSKLAYEIAGRGKDVDETRVALRKLLEAKDAAVRSVVP